MHQKIINNILREIETGYDLIADKFSHTRSFFWSDLNFIADHVDENDVVLDFGCGNGRLVEILETKKINYYGVDVSQKLIDLANEKYQKEQRTFLKITSQGSLAFSNNFFNKIISVAVFHHFPPEHASVIARELYRIMKPDGVVIVSAWNLWQKKTRKNILSPGVILKKILHLGKYSGLGVQDIFVPFKNNQGDIFERYHYVYTLKSLAQIFSQAGFKIEKAFLAGGKNIVIIAKKKDE